jgi:hypothetical protein
METRYDMSFVLGGSVIEEAGTWREACVLSVNLVTFINNQARKRKHRADHRDRTCTSLNPGTVT